MTAKSAAHERASAWKEALTDCGYQVDLEWGTWLDFKIHAERPDSYGAPHVVIDVGEAWLDGSDPLAALDRSLHGAYLAGGSAHAQFVPGEEGSHRVDTDPSKPVELTIHLHPIGSPNEHRVPLPAMPVPGQWVHEIEKIADQLGLGIKPQDVKF